MRTVLMTMVPHMWELIKVGCKTLDLRTIRPKLDPPFRVVVSISGGGGVVGEFVCKCVKEIQPFKDLEMAEKLSCVEAKYIWEYSKHGRRKIFGWDVSEVQVYQNPLKVSDFGLAKAPRTWQYVKED